EAVAALKAAQAAMAEVPASVRAVPKSRLDTANTWMTLGSVYGKMRRFTEGEAAMRHAAAAYAALANESPDDLIYGSQHAAVYHNLGTLLQHASKDADAEAAFRKSLDLSRPKVARHPGSPLPAGDMANTLITLASHLMGSGRTADAEPFAAEAEDLW